MNTLSITRTLSALLLGFAGLFGETALAREKNTILSAAPLNYEMPGTDRVLALSEQGICRLMTVVYKVRNDVAVERLSEHTIQMAEGGNAFITATGNIASSAVITVRCINGKLKVNSPFPRTKFKELKEPARESEHALAWRVPTLAKRRSRLRTPFPLSLINIIFTVQAIFPE